LIGVTEFFRDRAVFEGVRTEVLLRLAGRAGTLRVWSAGCSTGEEVYSMAILLAEAGLLERSWLLGTDCRSDAIQQAHDSIYGAAALEPLDESIRAKYFEPVDDGRSRRVCETHQYDQASGGWCVARTLRWRPVDALRRQIHWKVADVSRTVETGPWDIILCRNLAIYLKAEPAAKICTRLADALRPGGFLIAGRAGRPRAGLGLLFIRHCIYHKTVN
jgi:chemotaxis protein methyltransferase CheR